LRRDWTHNVKYVHFGAVRGVSLTLCNVLYKQQFGAGFIYSGLRAVSIYHLCTQRSGWQDVCSSITHLYAHT